MAHSRHPVKAEMLLGGRSVLGQQVKSPIDAHELVKRGLPSAALQSLLHKFVVLKPDVAVHQAMGLSVRTIQRRKETPQPLSIEQSSRVWRFAEILAHATNVLGSQEEAEKWLEQPAVGLGYRRPIDLLATPPGTEMVESLLTRMEYGVYI